MTLTGAMARFGLIATVSAIIAVGTLAPLLKQPSQPDDRGAMVAFAPALVVPPDAGQSAAMPADDIPRLAKLPASTVGAADASPRSVTRSELPSPEPVPPTVVTMRHPTEEAAPSAAHPDAETLQAPEIVAATEPAKVREGEKRKRSSRVVRPDAAPYYSNDPMTGQWASRAPRARSDSTPFSYNKQLGAQ